VTEEVKEHFIDEERLWSSSSSYVTPRESEDSLRTKGGGFQPLGMTALPQLKASEEDEESDKSEQAKSFAKYNEILDHIREEIRVE